MRKLIKYLLVVLILSQLFSGCKKNAGISLLCM